MERWMQFDYLTHKASGEVCDHYDGAPITWNGHLCEGANLAAPAPVAVEFCLWTKCGKHDVPANAAQTGDGCIEYVTCEGCLASIKHDNTEAA